MSIDNKLARFLIKLKNRVTLQDNLILKIISKMILILILNNKNIHCKETYKTNNKDKVDLLLGK